MSDLRVEAGPGPSQTLGCDERGGSAGRTGRVGFGSGSGGAAMRRACASPPMARGRTGTLGPRVGGETTPTAMRRTGSRVRPGGPPHLHPIRPRRSLANPDARSSDVQSADPGPPFGARTAPTIKLPLRECAAGLARPASDAAACVQAAVLSGADPTPPPASLHTAGAGGGFS